MKLESSGGKWVSFGDETDDTQTKMKENFVKFCFFVFDRTLNHTTNKKSPPHRRRTSGVIISKIFYLLLCVYKSDWHSMNEFSDLWYECDGIETTTSKDQCECEKECSTYLHSISSLSKKDFKSLQNEGLLSSSNEYKLLRRQHIMYLTHGLSSVLPAGFVSLDSSRPWLCYWILHSLYLLGEEPIWLHERVISTLKRMQSKTGE